MSPKERDALQSSGISTKGVAEHPPVVEAVVGERAPCAEPQSIPIPEKSPREWGIALAIGVLSCLYLLAFRRLTSLDADEGLSLQGAQRILEGQVAHRDFFSLFTAGTYYWTALLFKVFGNSILVARTALAVYGGVFALITYLLARRVCSRRNAALGACLLTVTCLPYDFIFQHNWDSTLWACLALYCAVRFLESARWGWAVPLGFLASLTCLFEQSKGGGLVLGLAIGFLLISLTFEGRTLFGRRQLAALGLGVALPLAVTLVYFGANHALAPMLSDWLWPLQRYNSINSVPYGLVHMSPSELEKLYSEPLIWKLFLLFATTPYFVVPMLPILALVVLGRHGFALRERRLPNGKRAYYILVTSCIAGLLLSALPARPNFTHLMYLAPVFYLVLCWLFEGKAFGGTVVPAARKAITAYVVVSFAAFGLGLLVQAGNANYLLASRRGAQMTTQRDAVVDYVDSHVPAGSKIFVYPYQPLYYYLTGTDNPTSFDFLYPGYQTRAQFEQVGRQLEADGTPVVLLCPSFVLDIGLRAFPGTPLTVIAKGDPLIGLIFSRYRACKVLPSTHNLRYVFMTRKDLPCPSD